MAEWTCDRSSAAIVSSDGRATVLVVDDSAFMRGLIDGVLRFARAGAREEAVADVAVRELIAQIVDASPEFRVVGTARDGLDALRQIHALDPQIVTLDVEMPELDGVQTLGYVMSESPRAVVMLSAAGTEGGAALTLRCLELGAVDFVNKPSGPISLDLAMVSETLLDALRDWRWVGRRRGER